MRGSRRTAVAAAWVVIAASLVAAVAALGLAGPAGAVTRRPRPSRQVNTAVTGALTIAWAGDPAAGCAAAGLCGVHGSLAMVLGGVSSSSPGPAPFQAADSNATVRVQTSAPDGSVIPCADLVPVDFNLVVRHLGVALRGAIDSPGSFQLPSAGRCAGPTAADLLGLTLPTRRFGAHGYDMSGESSLVTGPFRVTVLSNVKIHITFGSQGTGGFFGGPGSGGSIAGSSSGTPTPPKPHAALQETARVLYRVTGFTGALTTGFVGAAPPACAALGTCGVTGQLSQTFSARGGIVFAGARLVTRRLGQRRALADLRRGRMRLVDTFSSLPLRETLTETIAQPASAACQDSVTVPAENLPSGLPGKGADQLALGTSQPFSGGSGADPFRTRCAGPSQSEILGAGHGTLAVATVTAGELGDRRLSVTFRGGGTFGGGPYAGRRGGALVLSLALVRSSGQTRRVKLFPGEPVVASP